MSNTKMFFNLLKSGLWSTVIDLGLPWQYADWDKIIDMARKQTVTGFVVDGISALPQSNRPPQQMYFNLIFNVNGIERKNKDMNDMAVKLTKKLKEVDCDAIIQKGQGVAVCYNKPEHRIAGDIDIFVGFEKSQYERANDCLQSIASYIGHNNIERRHAEYVVNGIPVEIHGSVDCRISSHCDNNILSWAKRTLAKKNIVTCDLDNGIIQTAPYNFDVLYIFIHFLGHYMNGGCGLRQLCDWTIYVYRNYDIIDHDKLIEDIESLKLAKFWQLFASVSVKYLGCPAEKMPLYDSSNDKKCDKLVKHIFSTGNFGVKQKEAQLSDKSNRLFKKIVTFVGQIPVYMDNFRQFPKETNYCFWKYLKSGIENI